MLIDKYGNKVVKLIVDSGCFPNSVKDETQQVKFLFPSLLMLELNEFCGKYESGLPKINPAFVQFINLMFLERNSIVHPAEDAIFGAAKIMENIFKFREKLRDVSQKDLQSYDEYSRSILGRLRSPTKGDKESLRFDSLFYSIAALKYIHEKDEGVVGYLSNNINDNQILINATFWQWDGAVVLGKTIDPYTMIPPVFTWQEYLKSKDQDVVFAPPRQVFYRSGTSHDVILKLK